MQTVAMEQHPTRNDLNGIQEKVFIFKDISREYYPSHNINTLTEHNSILSHNLLISHSQKGLRRRHWRCVLK